MAVVVKFFRWVWRKVSCWILSWRKKAKLSIQEHPDSMKNVLKRMEKPLKMAEPSKMVETPKEIKPPKEAKPLEEANPPKMDEFFKMEEFSNMDESLRASESCVLAETTDGMELGHTGRSLLRLPQTAIQSVSTLMVSALQSGLHMCSWKSSVSSASVTSQLRTGPPLELPEAEMLREVYLVLWAIRKQLRQLARRQERRRRRHIRAHASPQPDPVKGLKQDARSPL
ncbi:sperm acrosome developmental regulator [Trichechus manatus latirostris]|uniref:Sperm acrosome developmental regulator n=1 Tax=Trichechus manatus latirostris TaxID=127582 RepID=A0A2Y9RYS5_TRIMA|nr:sperm acrosome developmental regulator [Trichechus manatus latirostris]